MEAIRQIVDGQLLSGIITLPHYFQNRKVEIIVMPVEEKKADKPHLEFIGTMTQESFDEISTALLDTQRVDANEW